MSVDVACRPSARASPAETDRSRVQISGRGCMHLRSGHRAAGSSPMVVPHARPQNCVEQLLGFCHGCRVLPPQLRPTTHVCQDQRQRLAFTCTHSCRVGFRSFDQHRHLILSAHGPTGLQFWALDANTALQPWPANVHRVAWCPQTSESVCSALADWQATQLEARG